VNDVSGLPFDPALAPLCQTLGFPSVSLHAQGTQRRLQSGPRPLIEMLLLDVYDALERADRLLEASGIPRSAFWADPGIGGFAKKPRAQIWNC